MAVGPGKGPNGRWVGAAARMPLELRGTAYRFMALRSSLHEKLSTEDPEETTCAAPSRPSRVKANVELAVLSWDCEAPLQVAFGWGSMGQDTVTVTWGPDSPACGGGESRTSVEGRRPWGQGYS